MFRLTSRLTAAATVSLLALTLTACSDSSDQTTQASDSAAAVVSTETAAAGVTSEITGAIEAAVEAPKADGDVDMAKVLEQGSLKDMVLGEETAPVTIVEYMSMTCPHCASFHEENFKPLKEKYIDSGKVRFILREFPFDPRAAAAIMLARCAPEERFFPMVDVLFQQQRTWATAPDGREALLQIARLAGFTQESFEACLTNQKLLDDVNAVRTKAANEFGVQSTPTFIINGKRYPGNMSIEIMSAIIDPLL
ncbi:protein-disulfide isomerase [Hoeflea sp. IMCC20628]|uniref:DsbA family protein n=1 Tax=Hoeflea sp. IMCC20628 TaxID=1620421 RepID=UPI00063A9F07|nr:DsbA family protein [Hoeflea sp. IMCC20628]AKI01458.1 protein-disulfide isomerase [Hoeflea sp. IMCC20628]